MKLSFFGAAGEVTGSCTLLETRSARVLIDFGLHQGDRSSEARNRRPPPIDAPGLDAVVLTHAHIDHAGRMPMLPGLGGGAVRVWATPATCDLCGIMLRDSAHLQEADAERDARHYERDVARARLRASAADGERSPAEPEPPLPPLYTQADVEAFLPMLAPLAFHQAKEIAPGVTLRLTPAGHILGSASAELTVREPGAQEKRVVFSGDLGPRGLPLLADAERLEHADVVVLESTYGDRDHRPLSATLEEFEKIISDAAWEKEKVLIPAFAVGRSQQIMFHLAELGMRGRLPRFPVWLDSPMGIAATALYAKHEAELEASCMPVLAHARRPGSVPEFRFARTGDESRALNGLEGAAVIIAASGMCSGGRILHHLRHNLWRRGVHVVIAGYQPAGSLGRRLVDRAPTVRIFGETIPVRADIHTLGGFSAHAGQTDLLWWAESVLGGRPRLILNHGEDGPRAALAAKIKERWGTPATLPQYGETVEL